MLIHKQTKAETSPCLCLNLLPFSIHQYSLPFFGPLVSLFCLLPLLSLLLFIYETPLSLCHTPVQSPFILPYVCLLFPLFILPVLLCLYFIPVYATYTVPLPLFCSHYFHSTACTTPHSLLPFLLPLLGYDCCFHFAFD